MKTRFKTLLIGVALIAGLTPALTTTAQNTKVERHAYIDTKPAKTYAYTTHFGGIPLVTEYYGTPGLTPKEYGLRYGNGNSRKVKTNRILTAKRAKARH